MSLLRRVEVKEAEGYKLHLANRSDSTTGYMGVSKRHRDGRFTAMQTVTARGSHRHVGYGSPRRRWRTQSMRRGDSGGGEACNGGGGGVGGGLQIHIAKRSSSTTGYMGVYEQRRDGRFIAKRRVGDKQVHIGAYDTAVEAAVAYEACGGRGG